MNTDTLRQLAALSDSCGLYRPQWAALFGQAIDWDVYCEAIVKPVHLTERIELQTWLVEFNCYQRFQSDRHARLAESEFKQRRDALATIDRFFLGPRPRPDADETP